MSAATEIDLAAIRTAMANFEISPSVVPNETIDLDRAFFPEGHRGVLDLKRQLVVGNRGMGKSFWTHALVNPDLRARLARAYSFPALTRMDVAIGFNGSEKLSPVAPTIGEIQVAHGAGNDPELIWKAVILRAVRSLQQPAPMQNFAASLAALKTNPGQYAEDLSATDDTLGRANSSLLIVFDALDRLAQEWGSIHALTKGLLLTVLGLQSFRGIKAKVFMRVDQFAEAALFKFPDSSKIRNDCVDLAWRPSELYGLVISELLRAPMAAKALETLTERIKVRSALPREGQMKLTSPDDQEALITAMAGQYLGGHRKRGRVYSWVPLHLSDAANNCSPRTFLTAWRTAANHTPEPSDQVVNHLGLIEGVRIASSARLAELREDYPWIDLALNPLRGQLVPIEKTDLFALWQQEAVTERIVEQGGVIPIGVVIEGTPDALLRTMTHIAVMEVRANGKINVPDIFRVEANILRKGGVAVPRRNAETLPRR